MLRTTLLLRWPLPALGVWCVAWFVHAVAVALGVGATAAFIAGSALGAAGARLGRTTTRRVIIAAGFPLAFLATAAAAGLPPWLWLTTVCLLALLYPVQRWGDAPLFPTPSKALQGLARLAPLPAGSRILDAGSGSGAALRALHAEYPNAQIDGIEWSWPLCWLSAWRCPWAQVRRGDIWTADWSGYDMVYVFQRPETMARAAKKAAAELRRGALLVSLEFQFEGEAACAHLPVAEGRAVWVYTSRALPKT